MPLLTKAPRGTGDILPKDSHRWQAIRQALKRTADIFGFKEISFPTFEHTELFTRSVGDTTDVVQKEMYTFMDKGDRSITLRPEGTAGTVRAVLEHGLLGDALPLKVCYDISCFRYEKPQAGRLREFHQFGAELFGAQHPAADAQLISLAHEALLSLGIDNTSLYINSIGCPKCRPNFHQALMAYFAGQQDQLCPTCQGRLDKNPMRILDCKNPTCAAIAKDAPVGLDYLCQECSTHFDGLKQRLALLDIPYAINPKIVRGLDYYTKTVFEFVSENIGAQGTVCGGGRYDGLIEQLGGAPTPALGFAMGLERLLMVMQAKGEEFPEPAGCDVYLISMDDASALEAFRLCGILRAQGLAAECDLMGRSFKAQLKYSDKIHAKYSIVLGETELQTGKAKLKNMQTGDSNQVSLQESFATEVLDTFMKTAYMMEEENA